MTIGLNATTQLQFTITNPATNSVALTGVAFSDTLPAGLTVINGTSSVCNGTSNLSITGGNTISLSGTTVNINSQCQFNVQVTGTASGNYSNTVNGSGKITSTKGGTGADSNTATLTVCSDPVTVTNTNDNGPGSWTRT